MKVEEKVRFWEDFGFDLAWNDPDHWEKSLAHASEARRIANEAEIVEKSAEGRLCQDEIRETTEHLNAGGGAPSTIGIIANLISSGLHALAACGLFCASFFLTLWIISPFRL